MNHKKVDYQLAIVAVVLLIVAFILLALFGGPGKSDAAPRQTGASVTCFSAKLWSADDRDRPCYRIARPEEDGSGRLWVGAARGSSYRCLIPAERPARRFTIRCEEVR